MAFKLSTGCRAALMSSFADPTAALSGTNLAFTSGGGVTADAITDSGNRFISAGFVPGRKVRVFGATTSGNNKVYTVTEVAAGTLTLGIGDVAQAEAFPAAGIVTQAKGYSFLDLFAYGLLRIFSSSQPTTADLTENGSILLEITLGGATFAPGTYNNGLLFENRGAGVIGKKGSAVWSGTGLVAASMGWFRLYANDVVTGASTTAIRCDGSIGLTGANMNVSNLAVTVGVLSTLNDFTVTLLTA